MQKKGAKGNHQMQIRTPVCTRACVCSLRGSCVRACSRNSAKFRRKKNKGWGADDVVTGTLPKRGRREMVLRCKEGGALAGNVALFPSVKKMAERLPAGKFLRAGPTRYPRRRRRRASPHHPHHPPCDATTTTTTAAADPACCRSSTPHRSRGERNRKNPLLRLSRSSSPPSKKMRD